jgi:histidyl-tRNA synthetase
MKEIKETTYKGTRILLGNEKRKIVNSMIKYLVWKGYDEISIPVIQLQETFSSKVGKENNNMMFNFTDRGNRDICLAPEYTAVIQKLANTTFKNQKDVKLFYVQECFRGENPQSGRYRQFTQFGVEIINPTKSYLDELIDDASELIKCFGVKGFEINRNVVRGLDYYKEGRGFEISYDKLGSSKQICGGGEYEGGVGFAIGVDRLLKCNEEVELSEPSFSKKDLEDAFESGRKYTRDAFDDNSWDFYYDDFESWFKFCI